jgi:hypothetical protein
VTKRFSSLQAALLVSAVGLCSAAHAQIVALGTDYLSTGTNTYFALPGYPTVQFKGDPLAGLGTTDTVVEREENANLATGPNTIPIQVTKLSLESTAPVTIGGTACNLFVGLDPANLAKDIGQMTIIGGPPFTSGTFDSTFTLFWEVKFKPVVAGQICPKPITGNCQFGQNGAPWQSKPLPSEFLVKGPENCTATNPPTPGHCLGTKDQKANEHVPLRQGTVDFYPVNAALHATGGGQHVVCVSYELGTSHEPCEPQ